MCGVVAEQWASIFAYLQPAAGTGAAPEELEAEGAVAGVQVVMNAKFAAPGDGERYAESWRLLRRGDLLWVEGHPGKS